MLANVPVHDIAKELNITREQVYAKYMAQTIAQNSWQSQRALLLLIQFLVQSLYRNSRCATFCLTPALWASIFMV